MKSVAADSATPADLKKYGLDRPEATVTVRLGSARAALASAARPATDTVYARDTSKPVVVTVDSTLADDCKKGAEDYRRKDVFEFRAFNATRAEFTRNGQTVTLERVKGKSEEARTAGDASAQTRPTSTEARSRACWPDSRTCARQPSSPPSPRPASTRRPSRCSSNSTTARKRSA